MPVTLAKPLFIAARRGSWRMLDWHANEGDREYAVVRKAVLMRDNHVCRYCHFRSLKYQHLHHVDDDHNNNVPDNLVTACPFCHQCFHLGLAGVHHSGMIIYAPEIEQAELNNIARAIFVAVHNGGANEPAARTLYSALESRRAVIEEQFGRGTSMPSTFGQAFVDMGAKQYRSRRARMPGLRLLPKMQAFGQEIAYWRSDHCAFGKLADARWRDLYLGPPSAPEAAPAAPPQAVDKGAQGNGEDHHCDQNDGAAG
jgi:intracellular multiplication protein IcmJ